MSETPSNIGARAVCRSCGNIIEYVGPYWRHLGAFQPRHIAMPQEGTTEDRIAMLERERDALRAALDAVAEHLRPALEAEAGATAGPWREVGLKSGWYIRSDAPEFDPEGGFVCESGPDTWDDHDDVRLVLALRNALPAVRATLKGVGK